MAKWVRARRRRNFVYYNTYRQCSDCWEATYRPLEYKFCPHCGAKMDEPKSRNYHDFDDDDPGGGLACR